MSLLSLNPIINIKYHFPESIPLIPYLVYHCVMLNRRDNHMLMSVRSRILKDPSGDYDDALFHSFLTSSGLGKEVYLLKGHINDNGKRYIAISLSEGTDGEWTPLRTLIYGFSSDYVEYDGFVMDGIIIEKDFIEEIISGLDESGVSAVVGDVLAEEAEAAVIPISGSEIITSVSTDTPQDLRIELPVEDPEGNDEDRKHLAASFFQLFSKVADLDIHSLAIPVFRGYDPSLFADIALSSVSAFLHMHPDYFIQIVFTCRDEKELEALSGASEA